MAHNLQILKRRIKTAKNISQIAKAMEMIAASKIKRAQNMIEGHKPYAQAIIEHAQGILRSIQQNNIKHPYLLKNPQNKRLLIVISPDKGLCGSLITNMVRRLLEEDFKNSFVITIGRKLERTLLRLEANLIATFPMGTAFPNYSFVFPLIELINEYYIQKKVSVVEVMYPEFTSIFTQTPTLKKILPISLPDMHGKEENIYLIEPSQDELLDSLLPYYLEITLYSFLIEAHTSEQAARMIAMQNAKNNANDIADTLTLTYNKSRQERITNELLDLTNVGQQT